METHHVNYTQAVEGDFELFNQGLAAFQEVAIFMLDPQGVIKTWMPAAEALFGYSSEEILEKSLQTLRHVEDAGLYPFCPNHMQHNKRESVHLQGHRKCKDNTHFFAQEIICTIYDEINPEQLLGYSVVIHKFENDKSECTTESDLTPKNHISRFGDFKEMGTGRIRFNKIDKCDSYYHKLVQATHSVIFTLSKEGKFETPQVSWERFTGQTWNEYKDFGWLNAIRTKDRATLLYQWEHASQNKAPHLGDYKIRTKDGTYRYVTTQLVPVYDSKDRFCEWLAACIDIHQLKIKEAQLDFINANMRLALESARIGTWNLDPKSHQYVVDGILASMLGIEGSDVVYNIDLMQKVHPEDKEKVQNHTTKCIQQGIDYDVRARLIKSDGTTFTGLIRGTRVELEEEIDVKERKVLIMGVVWDITDQRKLEEDRFLAIQEAEHIQQERVKEAEVRKQFLQDIIHLLCHEIRTPLTGVLGVTEWLAEVKERLSEISRLKDSDEKEKIVEEAVEKIDEIVDISNECVSHLSEVVTNILEHAKIEAGKVQVNQSPFDPARIVSSVVKMQRANKIMLERQLQMFWELPGGKSDESDDDSVDDEDNNNNNNVRENTLLVTGDSGKWKIILINLISNAIKYTAEGHVKVSLEYDHFTLNKVYCRVIVEDTGTGMTPEETKELFEKFKQFGGEGTSGSYGSGLGLYIVKGYVKAMNGIIHVTSEKGIGSKFIVEIPFDVVPPENDVDKKRQIKSETQRNNEIIDPKTVLIVEDNVINQKILVALLKNKGHNCQLARNGKEAVELVEQNEGKYDVILMDVQMPVMNGYDATKNIRKMEKDKGRTKYVPIVALSGNTAIEDKEEAFKSGMQDYVVKPYRADEIESKIKRWTRGKLL